MDNSELRLELLRNLILSQLQNFLPQLSWTKRLSVPVWMSVVFAWRENPMLFYRVLIHIVCHA